MLELAKTDEQKATLDEQIQRYKQGYLEKYGAYLHSHSNVASAFIVGPAKFPTARMEKRGRWADNKLTEFLGWDKRARAAIRQAILDARPQEEKDAAEWLALRRDIAGSLAVLEGIDAGTSPYV